MRTLGSAVVTVALALNLGGCNVTVGGERSDRRAAIEDVVGDGELTVDLTAPPSREDVALGDGRKTVILERDGREPYDLTVVFADGSRLQVPVVWVSLTADDADSAPTMLVARRAGEDLEGVRAAVEEGVRDFGVDASRAEGVLASVADARSGQSDVIRTLPTSVPAPERLSIQPIGRADRDEYVVNYTVEWDLS